MKEEIIKLINGYWRFDDYQQPMSSYHEKQDLLKEINKLFPTELERCYSGKEVCDFARELPKYLNSGHSVESALKYHFR